MNRRSLYSVRQWIANGRALIKSWMFWSLLAAFLVISAVVWSLPAQPVGLFIRAFLTGASVALVITHYNGAQEFFSPLDERGNPGQRGAGHWYAFSHWLFWVFLMLSMGYGYTYAWLGQPAWMPTIPLYNNIMVLAACACLIQVIMPYLAHDEAGVLRIKLTGRSTGVLHAALIIAAVTTIILLFIT